MYDLKQGRIPEESYPKCDCKRYLIVPPVVTEITLLHEKRKLIYYAFFSALCSFAFMISIWRRFSMFAKLTSGS